MSYGPTRSTGKRKRPPPSVTVSVLTFVSVCRATIRAPGTTAPCASTTRPLMLAVFTVTCAAAGGAHAAIRHASAIAPAKLLLLISLLRAIHCQTGLRRNGVRHDR